MQAATKFRAFSWLTLATTLAVIVWGGYVRASGSGAGCGSHWPLCNGEIVPRAGDVQTLVEYTHRITSGLVMILSVVQLVWARKRFPKGNRVRYAAGISLFFMMTEALVGAGIVLLEYVAENASIARAIWMGAHLINTFLLVAAMTITAHWAGSSTPLRLRERTGTALGITLALVGMIFVGTTGAIAALGDTLFPASSLAAGLAHDFSPTAHILVRLRVVHPLAALATAAYVLVLARTMADRGGAIRKAAFFAQVAVLSQVAAGFVNLLLLAPISMQMVHLLLADVVWIAIIRLGVVALSSDEPVVSREPAALATSP